MRDSRWTLLLVEAGLFSLLLVPGALRPLVWGAIGLVAAWSFLRDRIRFRLPVPVGRALDLVAVSTIVLFASTAFSRGRATILVLEHALILAQVSRLLRRRRRRDLPLLHGMALAQVALAAFLTRESWYPPLLLLTMLFAVGASVAALPRLPGARDARVYLGQPRGGAGRRAWIGTASLPAALGLCLVLLGVIFFVLLPRGRMFQAGEEPGPRMETADPEDYSGDREDAPECIMGFSDRVRLGRVGRIKARQIEAFRVKLYFRGRPTMLDDRHLYFRGAILDTWDGLAWSRSRAMRSSEKRRSARELPARVPIHPGIEREKPGLRVIDQEYRMRSSSSRTLVALGTVTSVRLDRDLPWIRIRGGDGLDAPGPLPEGLACQVRSLVALDPEHPAPGAPLDARARAACLAIPSGEERVVALGRRVAGKGTVLEKAARLTSWLQSRCTYTLLFRERPAGSPLDDFLFTSHAGHCEYFATALAVLLRAGGVPTRLVAGYHGGQWLESSESYYVRMSQAHAWVEAWMPGRGWIRLDPTPGDDSAVFVARSRLPGRSAGRARHSRGERILGFIRDFGPAERSRLVSAAGEALRSVFRPDGRRLRAGLLILLGGTVLLLSVRLGRRLWRRARGRAVSARPHRRAPVADESFYRDALRILARDGLSRRASQSPAEFLAVVRRIRGDRADPFREITRAFEAVRYGERIPGPDEARRLRELCDRLVDPAEVDRPEDPGGRPWRPGEDRPERQS